jgi:hypothetical protein
MNASSRRVVVAPLEDRRTRELRDVPGPADVVGVEVRDHDPHHGAVELGEGRRPVRLGVVHPEAGVDERPAVLAAQEVAVHVVDSEREPEGDPPDPVGHAAH